MSRRKKEIRESYRIQTDLDAILRVNKKRLCIRVVNISTSGLGFESDFVFSVNDYSTIVLNLHNSSATLHCRIVRADMGVSGKNNYGCKYEYVKESDLKKICSYILGIQALARWQKSS